MADLIAQAYDRHIPHHCRGRLVDLGCGQVPLYEAYKPYIVNNVCVDWANTIHGNQYLDLECDLSEKLPFEDEKFDTAILSDVLEHVPRPDALCKEIGRILAPGGKLLLNVPFYYWVHEAPHDFYRYTEFALRRFLAMEGFNVLVLERLGGVPEILADIVSKTLVERAPVVGKSLAAMLQAITHGFVTTAIGRKVSHATSEHFPLGYFMVAEKRQSA